MLSLSYNIYISGSNTVLSAFISFVPIYIYTYILEQSSFAVARFKRPHVINIIFTIYKIVITNVRRMKYDFTLDSSNEFTKALNMQSYAF